MGQSVAEQLLVNILPTDNFPDIIVNQPIIVLAIDIFLPQHIVQELEDVADIE